MKFDPPRIYQGPLSGRIFCVTHGKVLKVENDQEYIEASVKYDVTEQVQRFIAEYERTVTTTRLCELLAERGPSEIIPTEAVVERREVVDPCVVCGEPIQPGQAYALDGPEHIGCRR